MTNDEFIEEYDGAPLSLEEFAWGAAEVEDNQLLRGAAKKYLEAKRQFEHALHASGVELG